MTKNSLASEVCSQNSYDEINNDHGAKKAPLSREKKTEPLARRVGKKI